jgi:hypothetical protein
MGVSDLALGFVVRVKDVQRSFGSGFKFLSPVKRMRTVAETENGVRAYIFFLYYICTGNTTVSSEMKIHDVCGLCQMMLIHLHRAVFLALAPQGLVARSVQCLTTPVSSITT